MATVVDDLVAGDEERVGWWVDPATLGDDELVLAVSAAQLARSRIVLQCDALVAEWESRRLCRRAGAVRPVEALSRVAGVDPRVARRELRRARCLREMPHTGAAVAAGRVSIGVVDLMLVYATEARWKLFLRDEQLLVDQLGGLGLWDDQRTLLAYWAMRVDDELAVEPAVVEPSRVYLSRHQVTGEGDLSGRLGAIDAEIVQTELDRLIRQIAAEDKAAGVTRSGGERRAVALVRMAARSVNATGATARPLLSVVVGADTATRLCETASGIVLHPSQVEPLLGTAVIEAFLFDGPTRVVGVSRKRTFTGALRRAIQVRDRHCQHASGCSVRADYCDVDHIVPWIVGGETAQWNGRLLCAPHNRHPELRDQPAPSTPSHYSHIDEQIHRHHTCAAFYTDATAPPPGPAEGE